MPDSCPACGHDHPHDLTDCLDQHADHALAEAQAKHQEDDQ